MKLAALLMATAVVTAAQPVKTYEGSLTIPTYEHPGRELEPPLFAQSTVQGMYPFPTFLMPFKPGGPVERKYKAIYVENEYLKLTYIPEFGGRFFSLFDKLRNREVWYRNDVIKSAPYNPRQGWPQSGAELTGPRDVHMLTLNGEPFWANQIVRHADGSVSLALGQLDPVYQMKVNFTATLYPGVAALQLSIFCYNTQAARMPQMLWVNTAIETTPKTRFIYPMSRTVGHTTADIADWPVHNGIDYSWDRNNRNMLGVFGIDVYDNFQGAYQFDKSYGLFRWADRRVVQGMKLWTFGYGAGAKNHERGYTDKAGPYVELQSGRHVWDGHYEWVPPHKVESWSEWWIPVAGTNGLTTLTRDVALNLERRDGRVIAVLAATRRVPGATFIAKTNARELVNKSLDLDPAKVISIDIPGDDPGLTITIADKDGVQLLEYHQPTTPSGRKEYTPFTRPLEKPKKPTEAMSAEELTLEAESRLKELDAPGAIALLEKALAIDAGFSRAHVQLGIHYFTTERYEKAAEHLEKAIERDPYADEAFYYLAMSQLASGEEAKAERNLYYIWPGSAYFGEREHYLGRIALWHSEKQAAIAHFKRALSVNAEDLWSRVALAMLYRTTGNPQAAARELADVERIDPTSRLARAERYFATKSTADKSTLLRLLGGQSQEALGVTGFYRAMRQWRESIDVLQLVARNNRDPYGTSPEFYYVLAYCLTQFGDEAGREAALKDARNAAKNIDRFPYRADSEMALQDAVAADSDDAVARHALACLLYYRGRPDEAIEQWKTAVLSSPHDFSIRRALGLALAEQGAPVEESTAQLEEAVKLNPAHIRTVNDLSSLYANAGRFDDQLNVLRQALARSPDDDDLADGLLTVYLVRGDYDSAAKLIENHRFSPRHRTYALRDKYRLMRSGAASRAFNQGEYARALDLYTAALHPPDSLGADDFAGQTSPRIEYYRGRTLDAMGRTDDARKSYEKAIEGMEFLRGDRDSWSSENFHMVFALQQLGRTVDATRLREQFVNFANGERNDGNRRHRAEAHYVLALAARSMANEEQSQQLLKESVASSPDFLPARIELRGDSPTTRDRP